MNSPSDIKFYSCKGSSSSFKVELLFLEMRLLFDKLEIDLWKKENKTPWFLGISPLGLVPAVEIDSGKIKISESNTILRYLALRGERFDLYPANLEDRARVDQMIDMISFSFNEDLGALIWQNHWVPKISGTKDLNSIEKLTQRLKSVLDTLDFWLTKQSYLCGSTMSLADICLYSHSVVFDRTGLEMSLWSNFKKWDERMQLNPLWEKRVQEEKTFYS